MISEPISPTREYLDGGSGLDGEELLLAVLHENEQLMIENRMLRTAGFWAVIILTTLLLGSLLVR